MQGGVLENLLGAAILQDWMPLGLEKRECEETD